MERCPKATRGFRSIANARLAGYETLWVFRNPAYIHRAGENGGYFILRRGDQGWD